MYSGVTRPDTWAGGLTPFRLGSPLIQVGIRPVLHKTLHNPLIQAGTRLVLPTTPDNPLIQAGTKLVLPTTPDNPLIQVGTKLYLLFKNYFTAEVGLFEHYFFKYIIILDVDLE